MLVDKNIVEHLAAELPKPRYDELLSALSERFQLVFPFVLIEEIWANVGEPRVNQARTVIDAMVDIVVNRKGCWLADERELIFHELVIEKRTPAKMISVDDRVYQMMVTCKADTPGLKEFLADRALEKERIETQRRGIQDAIVPRGSFRQVNSENEFIGLITQKYQSTNPNEYNAVGYLRDCEHYLTTSRRHRAFTKRIRRGFLSYFRRHQDFAITKHCVIAFLLYAYLPVYRLRDGSQHGQPILRRSNQRNNIDDQRYVACGLMCNRLITADNDMVRAMRFLKRAKFWRGDVVEVEPQRSVAQQITDFLSR